MKKIILMLFCLVTLSIVLMNCKKEPLTDPTATSKQVTEKAVVLAPNVTEVTGPDVNCSNGKEAVANLALRQIVFGAPPSSVFYNFTLAAASDVAIFAQDCCIQDDVVEIYVDGCLIATVDSRGYPGPGGYSETHTVTLPAGNHQIEYRNTISNISASGWNVSETELPPSTVIIDGCDTGVPNIDVTCGNSMSEMIMQCAVGAANHGAFVSCAAHLTNVWKKTGLITGAQKDAIMSCVGSANIP